MCYCKALTVATVGASLGGVCIAIAQTKIPVALTCISQRCPETHQQDKGKAHIKGAARDGARACQPQAVGQLGQLGRAGTAAAVGASLAGICGAIAESGGGAAVAGAQVWPFCSAIPRRVCTAVGNRPATMRGSGRLGALQDMHIYEAGCKDAKMQTWT